MKHRRTKATDITMTTKRIVYARDNGCCIFCGRPGLPEAHVISRAKGGMGCERNIVTVCRSCHDRMDNSTMQKEMHEFAERYLQSVYPDWNRAELIYSKWKSEGEGVVPLHS